MLVMYSNWLQNDIELTKVIIKYNKIFCRTQLGDSDEGYRVYYKYIYNIFKYTFPYRTIIANISKMCLEAFLNY